MKFRFCGTFSTQGRTDGGWMEVDILDDRISVFRRGPLFSSPFYFMVEGLNTMLACDLKKVLLRFSDDMGFLDGKAVEVRGSQAEIFIQQFVDDYERRSEKVFVSI